MSNQIKALDIPIKVVGSGSQAGEDDGAELEYMTMPKDMDVFAAPIMMDDNLEEYPAAREKIAQLGSVLKDAAKEPSQTHSINISELKQADLDFINRFLGEGEVAAKLSKKTIHFEMQETVLAGVWRVAEFSANQRRDYIEIGPVPSCVFAETFADAKQFMNLPEVLPQGVINAPSVIAEINAKVGGQDQSEETHVINLSLLPQTPEDLELLNECMGVGSTVILSRGYGVCRITSTKMQNTWWVQYFNSEDRLILNTIEITSLPITAQASREDLEDSTVRLEEMVESVLL